MNAMNIFDAIKLMTQSPPTTNFTQISHSPFGSIAHVPATQCPSNLSPAPFSDTLFTSQPLSLSTTTTIPAFNAIGAAEVECNQQWSTLIEQNKQLIAVWQARLLAQGAVSDSGSSLGHSCSSDSEATTVDKTSAQGSPVNSDETSSSNSSRHKSKSSKSDKKKKKSKKNKDEPRNKQVNLFPRKKATEEHRSVDHIIFSLARLEPFFNLPLKQAATKLGICTTALKSMCRKFGLKRWPYKILKQAAMSDEIRSTVLA